MIVNQPTRRDFFLLTIALAGIAGAIALSIWWGDPASYQGSKPGNKSRD